MQSQAKPPAGVVFDCDMGNRIDDTLALAVLYGLDGKNEARLASVSVTKSNLKAAQFTDAILRFYVTQSIGQFAGFARTLPVGLADSGAMAEDTPILDAVAAKFPHSVQGLNDTAECPALIRNALTAQYDANAIVVLGGPATNLAAAMTLPGVKDLIVRKVRHLVMACGAFSGAPDPQVKADVAAARKVLAEWPTSVILCGREVGDALPYPAASIEKDFAWTPSHPVVEAYRAAGRMPWDAPTQSAAAMLHAVRAKEAYFQLSDAGTVTVQDDGTTKFTANPQGRHRYLIADAAQKDRAIAALTELASMKPVPRRPRFQPPVQEPKKPAPPAQPPTR